MSGELHLKVMTPEKTIYDQKIEMLQVSTPSGEVGILPNHTDFVTKVTPGEMKITINGKISYLAVGEGVLQIKDNELTILTDLAIRGEEIDEKIAQETRERALLALTQKLSDQEYATTVAVLEKSLAQIRVKRRHRVN